MCYVLSLPLFAILFFINALKGEYILVKPYHDAGTQSEYLTYVIFGSFIFPLLVALIISAFKKQKGRRLFFKRLNWTLFVLIIILGHSLLV
jgi:hypothetical protein